VDQENTILVVHDAFSTTKQETLTFCSESGRITTEILIKVLEYFDKNNVFPRSPGGPTPFLFVDGHNTCFDPRFLEYIDNTNHWWNVCFGVLYATSLWQLGDSAENNGAFKTVWYHEKEKLLLWKYERWVEGVIWHYDVIPLLNKVFHRAFGQVAINQQAISDHGWGPLNQELPKHPQPVLQKSVERDSSQSSDKLSGLNITIAEGVTVSLLDWVVRARVKNKAAKQEGDKRIANGSNIQKNIKDAKWVSAGVLTKNGVFAISNTELIAGLTAC